MKNKKRAGFKIKKTPTKYSVRLKTWDDYFDQDRFDSRAVNKRLSKSQRQYKIAQKKKAFEKRQAAALATAGMNPGGTQYPGKPNFYGQMMDSLNQGVMGDGPKQGGMLPGTMGSGGTQDMLNTAGAASMLPDFTSETRNRLKQEKREAANQAFYNDPSEMFTKARATREREAKRKAAEQTWINSLKTGGGFYNVSPGGSSFTMKRGGKPNFKDLGSSKK